MKLLAFSTCTHIQGPATARAASEGGVTVQMTTKKEEGGRRGRGEEDNQKRSSMRERMSGHFSPGLFFLGG